MRRQCAAVPWLSRQKGRDHDNVKFVDHAWMVGRLSMRARCLGFNPADDTWQPSKWFTIADVCAYTRRNGIESTPMAKAGKISKSDSENDEKEGTDRSLADESSSKETDEEQDG